MTDMRAPLLHTPSDRMPQTHRAVNTQTSRYTDSTPLAALVLIDAGNVDEPTSNK